MTNLVDIIRAIVSEIDREVKVLSVASLGNNEAKATVCSTKYITKCKIVEDSNGNQYEVINFERDDFVDLKPVGNAPEFNDTVIIATPITYLHGTPASVNNEYLTIESRETKKTPFIWLLETYEEQSLESDSSIEAAYTMRLFFMEGAVEEQANTKHNDEAIKPMKSLTELFLDVIREDFNFKTLSDVTRTPRPRFGVEVLNRGSDRRIIDAALSGYEMRLTLEVYDTTLCKTNC